MSMAELKFNRQARQHKYSVNALANKEEHFPAQSRFILAFLDYKGLTMRMEIHFIFKEQSVFQSTEARRK